MGVGVSLWLAQAESLRVCQSEYLRVAWGQHIHMVSRLIQVAFSVLDMLVGIWAFQEQLRIAYALFSHRALSRDYFARK